MTNEELIESIAKIPYWYHKIPLRDGIITPGWSPLCPDAYRIPDDLTGKAVLDVGAWDGFWSFEAAKRGAIAVVAIDDFSDTCGTLTNADRSKQWSTFDLCNEALGFERICKGVTMSVYNIGSISFDNIFCFGVLYHLRHPLLALEKMRKSCRGTIHIETAILDGCTSAKYYDGSEMSFEFFPRDEYGRNASNWWVGTLKAWCGLVEAAGFKNIESWKLTDNPTDLKDTRGFIKATV